MTFTAFLLILASAFFHSSWNFLSKAHRPSLSFSLIIQVVTLVLTLPFLVLLPVKLSTLPPLFWWMLSLSIVAETFYCTALMFAYKWGDISISYPLSRSIPVLLTALVSFLFHLGESLTAIRYMGLATVFVGCLILPQKNFSTFRLKNFITPALLPICLAGMGTTGYTIADSIAGGILQQAAMEAGASRIIGTGAYFFLIQVGLVVTTSLAVAFASPRGELRGVVREPYSYLAGALNFGSYMLVLTAYGFATNASYVQAFRQIGLPLGVAAGVIFLHERLTLPKVIGLLLLVTGLVLTVL